MVSDIIRFLVVFFIFLETLNCHFELGSQVGIAVIIRISHLCGPGIESWTLMWAEICRSLSDSEGFSPGTLVFLPHKNRQ